MLKEKRITVNICGDKRPFFVFISPTSNVLDPDEDDDAELEAIEIDEPAKIFVFHADDGKAVTLHASEDQVALVNEKENIEITSRPIDPSISASGEIPIRATCGEESCNFLLTASDIGKGEYTLEDELRTSILWGVKKKTSVMTALFKGIEHHPYPNLGAINEKTRHRSAVARLMEDTENGGKPILVNIKHVGAGKWDDKEIENGKYLLRIGRTGEIPHWEVELKDEAKILFDKYKDARKELLKNIRGHLEVHDPTMLDRPIYAAYPIYVSRDKKITGDRLVNYLNSYKDILKFVSLKAKNISWSELFILGYLDCVVNWSGDSGKNDVILLGPWHPLVVAKRFMMQDNLLGCAERYLNGNYKYGLNKLATLLEQVHGFRWHFSLQDHANDIERCYASATSDPGWHVGIKVHPVGITLSRLAEVFNDVENAFGLQVNNVLLGDENVIQNHVGGYFSAHPTKRAIGVRVKAGYDPGRMITALQNMLYTEDDVTELGQQLPGGVSLFFDAGLRNIEKIAWKTPPLCIYEYTDDEKLFKEQNVDIMIMPPVQGISFSDSRLGMQLPRGNENKAVFYLPIMKLAGGITGTPASISYENEEFTSAEAGVGAEYINTLSCIYNLFPSPLNIINSPLLPLRLRCAWTVLPGMQLDPAIFVKYIADAKEKQLEERALWDYNVDIRENYNSYFILSTIPLGFRNSVKGSPVLEGKDLSGEIVFELGQYGIAIGKEAMRTSEKALGVIGLVAAIRLFTLPIHGIPLPLVNNHGNVGFLLPVDSFQALLGDNVAPGEPGAGRRTDLIAMQLSIDENAEILHISCCAIECKYTGTTFPVSKVKGALEQAEQTYLRVTYIIEAGKGEDGILERLALADLVAFGLRIHSKSEATWIEKKEQKILSYILQGKYDYKPPMETAILVTTEADLSQGEAVLHKRNGWWIRLSVGNWPGITEGANLVSSRKEISSLFGVLPVQEIAGLGEPAEGEPAEEKEVIEGQPTEEKEVIEGQPSEHKEVIESHPIHVQEFGRLAPILIGKSKNGEDVYFNPEAEKDPLATPHVMVTGSSGKGKTMLLKTLVANLVEQGRLVFMLDFKNDFSGDNLFKQRAGIEAQHVGYEGLHYNPIIPSPTLDPAGNKVIPCSQHINGISDILKQTFSLGDQQVMSVKEAIRKCFKSHGIEPSGYVKYDPSYIYPDFSEICEELRENDKKALNRLDPLFDLGIFRENYKNIPFESVLLQSKIINLSGIDSDNVKNALSRIFVLSAHGYFNKRPHETTAKYYFVFDEAHRIVDAEFMEAFIRESRAYGVGIILSSQYPSDFGKNISSSLSTKIIHGNEADTEKVRDICELLGLKGNEQDVAELDTFQALVGNKHYKNIFISTLAYPQYLLYCVLKERGELKRDDISKIKGIAPDKLSFILNFMFKSGFIEEIGGNIKLA